MKKIHWYLVGLAAIGAVALVAVGTAGGAHKSTGVSGSVSIIDKWTGDEQKSFEAVLAPFKKANPGVKIKYTGAGDNVPQIVSTAVQGGNPPDIAAIAQPGLMTQFADQGKLKPLDFVKSQAVANFGQSTVDTGSVKGTFYGLFWKANNKSTIWYNVPAFKDAGVESPATWDDLVSDADTIKQSGLPAYSIGGASGWTLTDLFENIYLRTAGPEKYDQLSKHEIKWTDPSVKEALTEMGKVFKDSDNIAGGTSGALQTDFETSVGNVFAPKPKAAMIMEGDFVPGVPKTTLKPETGYNFFKFPSINDSPDSVVASGNFIVIFRDTPAVRAFLKYLVDPKSAEIWVARGGFGSPNKKVDPSTYTDPLLRETSEAMTGSENLRFDLSDLQPSAFGATDGQGLWKLFQDFLKNPNDVNGIAQNMEKAASAAY